MPLEADLLIDRRRLKRRLGFWRAAAVLLALGGLWLATGQHLPGLPGAAHVARLEISGTITENRRTLLAIDRLAADATARAVLVTIDSPGGSVSGGEALYLALARIRAAGKPLVVVMRGTAASAGYMAALPAERIFAHESTVTGSIGVILQSFEASELLARIGVTPVVIASGPLKDQPSPFRPLTEAGRARLNEVIADLYEQFVEKVAAGRNMSADAVRPLADGRIFSGRQALAAGLIDAIGDERTARAWLASAHQIPETLPVRTIAPRDGLQEMFATGLGRVLGEAFKTVVSEWLAVDGIGLLWQP